MALPIDKDRLVMLTVHIGLHKTGSTSIQVALRRGTGFASGLPREGDSQSDQSVFNRMRSLGGTSLVISDENLLGSCFDGYLHAPERARLLARAFTGTPYRLVVYLRPQLQWIDSVYIQHIQSGGAEKPEDFLMTTINSPYIRWRHLLEILRTESGADHVVARAYLPQRDVVRDFFSLTHLEVARLGSLSSRSNMSLEAEQVPILRTINEATSLTRPERQLIRGVLQEMTSSSRRDSSALPEELQNLIIENFREDWLALLDDPSCLSDATEFTRGVSAFDSIRTYAGGSFDCDKVRDEFALLMHQLCGQWLHKERSFTSVMRRRLMRVLGQSPF